MKKIFEVTGKWGKSEIYVNIESRKIEGYRYVQVSVVDQILEQINDKMRAIFGNYKWTIEGYKGHYEIIARDKTSRFIESQGKTPQEAFFNCAAVRGAFGYL